MQSLTPKTLAELAQALSAATEKAKIIAGGTDFIIKERAGKFAPDLLIYPGFIPELNTVTKENGVLRIGAAVPMNGITAALKDGLTPTMKQPTAICNAQNHQIPKGKLCSKRKIPVPVKAKVIPLK